MKPIHILCICLALGACSRAANIGRAPQMTAPQQTPEFVAMTNPPLTITATGADAGASLWTGGIIRWSAIRGPRSAVTS